MATKTKPAICLAGISANVNEFTTAHAACVKYPRTSQLGVARGIARSKCGKPFEIKVEDL
jgi:hypothetical protein